MLLRRGRKSRDDDQTAFGRVFITDGSGKPLPPALSFAGVVLMHAVILGVGAFLIHLSMQAFRLRAEAQNWLAIQGKVVESRLQVASTNSGYDFVPVVRYEYTIAGNRYAGGTWRFGRARVSMSQGDSVLAAFPVGSMATVYVNPTDPNQSVLDREHVDGSAMQFLGGLIMLAMGLIVPVGVLAHQLRRHFGDRPSRGEDRSAPEEER